MTSNIDSTMDSSVVTEAKERLTGTLSHMTPAVAPRDEVMGLNTSQKAFADS